MAESQPCGAQLPREQLNITISQRRRQLFPADDDDDNDELGHISPLESDSASSSVRSASPHVQHLIEQSCFNNTISDYVILEDIHRSADDETETPSPDRSLYHDNNIPAHNLNNFKNLQYEATPSRMFPGITLRTPQDSCGISSNLPKLIHKTGLESISNVQQHEKEQEVLQVKRTEQNSKVRTALFPNGGTLTVPTKSFYKEPVKASSEQTFRPAASQNSRKKNKSAPVYLCSRKSKSKRRYGEINAGVRHNIKKPKTKKPSKESMLKAAVNSLDNNAPLNVQNMQHTEKLPQASNTEKNKESSKENVETRKRARSPSPKLNNKFFKFNRTEATVTVDKHTKFQIKDGEISLVEKKNSKRSKPNKKLLINTDLSDLTVPENDYLIAPDKIDTILHSLDNDKENNTITVATGEESQTKFTIRAYDSVVLSENAIQLHTTIPEDSITQTVLLSPTSQMCSMTSGLALNSPKKAKQNITALLSDTSSDTISPALDMKQEKLFPVFYKSGTNNPSVKRTLKAPTNSAKKFKSLPEDQLLLDAGQKRFGVTQCWECELVYHMGDPNDEMKHLKYHNATNFLRFNGWKDERVVVQLTGARIIQILPSDPKSWLKKVKDLLSVVNRELGYYDMQVEINNAQVFLYIKGRAIAGCAVAEPKTTAYRMLTNTTGVDLCSEQSYPIKCGINRIWVSQIRRRQGVGTALLDAIRGNFMFGNILSKDDLAFTSPTECGKMLATKYFGTSNYLVYLS